MQWRLIATMGCRLNKSTLSTAVFNFGCIRVVDVTAAADAKRVALSSNLRPSGVEERHAARGGCGRIQPLAV